MNIQLEEKQVSKLKNILDKLYVLHGNEWFVVELSSIIDEIIIQEQNNSQNIKQD